MALHEIKFVASVCLTVSLLLQAVAIGEDKGDDKAANQAAAAKDEQPDVKTEVTPSGRMVSKLQAAFVLIDYGREENDPTSLLIAARILGTTPIRELKAESAENKESRNKVEEFDAEALTKQAQGLIAEAQKMTKELPASERSAVEALAKATTILLKERDKGVVNGPLYLQGTIFPNGKADPLVFRNINLHGNYTQFYVRSLTPGVDLDLRVVGAITGAQYGYDQSNYHDASVQFNHFPIAVVNVFIEAHGKQVGAFILTSN